MGCTFVDGKDVTGALFSLGYLKHNFGQFDLEASTALAQWAMDHDVEDLHAQSIAETLVEFCPEDAWFTLKFSAIGTELGRAVEPGRVPQQSPQTAPEPAVPPPPQPRLLASTNLGWTLAAFGMAGLVYWLLKTKPRRK